MSERSSPGEIASWGGWRGAARQRRKWAGRPRLRPTVRARPQSHSSTRAEFHSRANLEVSKVLAQSKRPPSKFHELVRSKPSLFVACARVEAAEAQTSRVPTHPPCLLSCVSAGCCNGVRAVRRNGGRPRGICGCALRNQDADLCTLNIAIPAVCR